MPESAQEIWQADQHYRLYYTPMTRIVVAADGEPSLLVVCEDLTETRTLSEILNRYKQVIKPSDWLAIADESGIGLRTIWREHKRWQPPPADRTSRTAERHRGA